MNLSRVGVVRKRRAMVWSGLALILSISGIRNVLAQVVVGGGMTTIDAYSGPGDPSRIQTFVNPSGANQRGTLVFASFGWSATGCPAAVKIKFFRPSGSNLQFLTERGPFDVTNPVHSGDTFPPVTQAFVLDPPVEVEAGDLIAITNVTSCGGPAILVPTVNGILPSPLSLVYSGDVQTSVSVAAGTSLGLGYPDVTASSRVPLTLLRGRFFASLTATNPRSGIFAEGVATVLTNAAGYFSLPAFTGDDHFPEVMVKMVDATDAPPPFGGKFWVFYSGLTDVRYSLTVVDQASGRSRTYSSGTAFCGGADTDAFPP